jgi:predicted branched-subunit amino acid permease
MRAGRHGTLFYLGSATTLWSAWLATTMLGHALGAVVALPCGHPLFFAAPAYFITLLVPIWRGRGVSGPWAIAAAVSPGETVRRSCARACISGADAPWRLNLRATAQAYSLRACGNEHSESARQQ